MEEVQAEVRRWGNSLGIVIPSDTVRREGLKPHDKVTLRIEKVRLPRPGSFGSLRKWNIDAQRLKDELRRDHEK